MKNNRFLIAGAIFSGVAALLHLGCIIFGGDWYRFFGAGEQMAQMAEAGQLYPTIVTSFIVFVLSTWSLYALSGAGIIFRLPLLRTGLCVIASIYLLRAVAFFPLIKMFPENSMLFWIISSSICLTFGLFYLVGVIQAWPYLSMKNI